MFTRLFRLPLCSWWRLLAFLIVLVSPSAAAQTVQTEDVEMSGISGSSDSPRRHFRLRNAARLTPQEAQNIYEIVQPSLRVGYARSEISSAESYQSWRQFNTSPYISVTHGSHYLNNYANKLGEVYEKYENAGEFPVGAIIAKDSFAVTETGGILLGRPRASAMSLATGNTLSLDRTGAYSARPTGRARDESNTA